jgi:hypothetical protein
MQQTQKRLTSGPWLICGRRILVGMALAVGLVSATVLAPPLASAQSSGLSIELNKAEDFDGSCVASFVFQNNLGATLDRFNLDLFLFDSQGVIVRRVTIDLAPLLDGKTRVAQFHLHSGACAEVSRILVNDIPQCRAESGESVNCLAGLAVSSRSAIALTK